MKSDAVFLLGVLFVMLAFLGIGDSVLLSLNYLSGEPMESCPIFEDGCSAVTTSPYSAPLGIPLAFLGVGYYLLQTILMGAYLWKRRDIVLRAIVILATMGFAASMLFIFIQAFLIYAFCFYCILSAVTSTLLAAIAWILFFSQARNSEPSGEAVDVP